MHFDSILRDYQHQVNWLYSLITDPTGSRYFIEKSLETRQREFSEQLARTADFLDFAGNPQARYNSIHVAGTSGKGSVVAMMAAILSASGLRTGYHISPYLQICNEKLVVDGRAIPPSAFAGLVRSLKQLHADWLTAGRAFNDLRYIEAWAVLTFLWFARQWVDWAVIETGLGGRYDPTNVLPAKLAVITNIDFDHVKTLGPDLQSIAWHKAGIIKPGGLAVTTETNPVALSVIEAEAVKKEARLYRLGPDFSFSVDKGGLSVQTPFSRYDNLQVAIPGRFQQGNAALAVAGLDILAAHQALSLPPEAVRTGLKSVRFPGRLELIQADPAVILDGAHNPHKMVALISSVRDLFPEKQITVLLGLIGDKDAPAIIKTLAPHVKRYIVAAPNVFGKPSLPPSELTHIIESATAGASVQIAPNVRAGLSLVLPSLTPHDVLLITGSLYLVGEAREHWFPKVELLRQLEPVPAFA